MSVQMFCVTEAVKTPQSLAPFSYGYEQSLCTKIYFFGEEIQNNINSEPKVTVLHYKFRISAQKWISAKTVRDSFTATLIFAQPRSRLGSQLLIFCISTQKVDLPTKKTVTITDYS